MYSNLLAQVAKTQTAVSKTAAAANNEILNTITTSLEVIKDVFLAIIILIIFYILGKILASRIIKSLQEAKGESLYPDMVALVNRFSVFGTVFIGIAAVLQFIFDLDFIQVVGFFGLGISFAFKDLLENLIAGAVIIIQNRFRVGDFIMIGGCGLKGKIMEIQTRATILKAIDGTEIVVPNSELMTNAIISYTAHHSRRIDFTIPIDFEADVEKAKKIAKEIIDKKDHVLKKPAPRVLINLGESTVNLKCMFWVDPQDKEKSWLVTKSDLIAEVKSTFDKEGILIPYPLYTYLDKKREIGQKKGENDQNPLTK